MIVPQKEHIKFYEQQIQAIEEDWLSYTRASVWSLWQDRALFIGRVWNLNVANGELIIRIQEGRLPRLHMPYQLCLVARSAGDIHKTWTFSYSEFRRVHTTVDSTAVPTTFLRPQEKWRFIGCDQVSLDFFQEIEGALAENKHPLVVLAKGDPPFKYLENLKTFVHRNPHHELLQLDLYKDIDDWKPHPLPTHDQLPSHILTLLKKDDTTIIQGPPGTGKSYLVAQICANYAENNKSVCVTTATNSTLIEIASKPALQELLSEGKLKKANLSTDEHKKLPDLKAADNLYASKGELLFVTNYILSGELNQEPRKEDKFDLLVIEEASQAFLATLAGFSDLGHRVLIVGDPMQLYPIILRENQCSKIHPSINNVIKGLETVSVNREEISHRITRTYRLTTEAAYQTGVFYDNQLESISDLNGSTLFNSSYQHLFSPLGGTSILKMDTINNINEDMVTLGLKIAMEINVNNPSLDIAVLSDRKVTIDSLYNGLLHLGGNIEDIFIETVDRIQGLTCDVTILVFESSIQFALQLNRFNVATSRAKRGTLIITGDHIDLLKGVHPKVQQFLDRIKVVKQS